MSAAADFTRVPLPLHPILAPRVWGGERIVRDLHPELRGQAGDDPIGECWAVSDVGEDEASHSVVASGPGEGETLRSLLVREPVAMLGAQVHAEDREPRLPLLFKFLDSSQPLSVQVHPPDALVADLGLVGEAGKTEAWFVLDAAKDAWIVQGLDGVEYQEYLDRCEAGRGGEGLRRLHPKRGDLVYLPSGTVHAMGPGLLLAEIQQSSDSTYRLYDWDRVGLDGKPRQIHIEEARPIVPPPLTPCPFPPGRRAGPWTTRLAEPDAPFTIHEFETTQPLDLTASGDRFGILCVLGGSGRVGEVPLRVGSACFVPAGLAATNIVPDSDNSLWGLWMQPQRTVL